MLVYRQKDNLIHRLHPLTTVAFVGVIFFLSLLFSHPFFLLGLFVALGAVILASDSYREWKGYLKCTLGMMALLMLINACVAQAGSTVLMAGPRVPGLGNVRITLEELAFGAGMGLRLLVIVSVFCLYTHALHPDKVLKLLSRWGSRSVLAVTLATRLFPLMIEDFHRVTDVQRCRGVKFATGKFQERVHNLGPVASVLLLSSLERSWQLAESMYARGYGSGPRTCYTSELWRPRDHLVILALLVAVVIAVGAAWHGWSAYNYYPRLASVSRDELKTAAAFTFFLSVPAILNRGWKKWPWLQSRI